MEPFVFNSPVVMTQKELDRFKEIQQKVIQIKQGWRMWTEDKMISDLQFLIDLIWNGAERRYHT